MSRPSRAVTTAEQSLVSNQKLQALQNLDADSEVYFGSFHLNSSAYNSLVYAVSADGKSWNRVGGPVPYQPTLDGDGQRDPDTIYYAPTGEFLTIYTKSPSTTTFRPQIGLCKTKDFQTVTQLPNIAPPGISPTDTWSGSWFVDGSDYYILFLPLGPSLNKNTFGVGWIKCLDPGTWSSWTNFVSLKATNSAWSAASDLNDPCIVKVGSTYHLFMDGNNGTSSGILHATSSSPLTGYSAPSAVSNHTSREGVIFIPKGDGTYMLLSEAIYGPVKWSESSDLSTWSVPADVQWVQSLAIGNGGVRIIRDKQAQSSISNAIGSMPIEGRGDESIAHRKWRSAAQFLKLYTQCAEDGNGDTSADVLAFDIAPGVITIPLQVEVQSNVLAVGLFGQAPGFARSRVTETGSGHWIELATLSGYGGIQVDYGSGAIFPLTFGGDGTTAAGGKLNLKGYTVATLPSGNAGDTAFVTDAMSPTFLGALTGGGSTKTPVFHNGSAWVAG